MARTAAWAGRLKSSESAWPPLLKDRKYAESPYLYDPQSRRQILEILSKSQDRFRLVDYLKAIQYSVSRQQALKDIRSLSWIRKKGKGKGSIYQVHIIKIAAH